MLEKVREREGGGRGGGGWSGDGQTGQGRWTGRGREVCGGGWGLSSRELWRKGRRMGETERAGCRIKQKVEVRKPDCRKAKFFFFVCFFSLLIREVRQNEKIRIKKELVRAKVCFSTLERDG